MHAFSKLTASATVLLLALPLSALGAENSEQDGGNWAEWTEARREAVHATAILDADVSNGFNTMGEVQKLVLSSDNQRVEYVIYEVPYPYALYGGEDGFVSFDNADLTHGGGLADLQVRAEPVNVMGPEQLKLSANEVDDRAVSRLIGESMRFENGELREVEDLLIHPKTGEVTHFVIQLNQEAIFSGERRTVPDNMVSITEEGQLRADMALPKIEDIQDFDPELL